MALFRHQVFMQIGTDRPWTNVWHVDAADLVTAASVAAAILAPDLQPFLQPAVTITRILTSTPGTPGAFIESFPDLPGTNSGGGELLPLFNTFRLLFNVGSGRNDSKYMRGLLTEAFQNAGVIPGATVTGLVSIATGLLGDMAASLTPLCDTDLNRYGTVSGQAAVQERQRHRRRRRTP
jgi:hypothetical protein